MSWFYIVNNDAYESKTDETLQSFLTRIAESYTSDARHDGYEDYLSITSLAIRFCESDEYELIADEAASFVESINASLGEHSDLNARHGSYHQQVAATHRYTTRA